MTDTLANLAGALRHEFEQYGLLLELLDRQQEYIGARKGDEVSRSIAPVKQQGLAVLKARTNRDECRAQLAQTLGRDQQSTFAELATALPEEGRALISSLVRQNNGILARVAQRARQNHLRLSRSIDLMHGLINSLFPGRISRVYNGRGAMKTRRLAPRSFYDAVG
jgi:hypothetical protein